jgi:hypothetical protein
VRLPGGDVNTEEKNVMNCSKLQRLGLAGFAPALAAVLIYAAGVQAAPRAPRIQTGPDAEVTYDGLYRVDRSVMDAAWVKPDLDLTGYTKLMLGSAGISYKKIDNVSRSSTQFPVREENKERLRTVMREEFVEELEKLERYELVSEPGPDVLMLVGGVIDVVSHVPSDANSPRFTRGGIYLSSVGAATLVVELRDSESNEVLARAADRRSAEAMRAFEYNEVQGWAEVRRLAKNWARTLRQRLEEFNGV